MSANLNGFPKHRLATAHTLLAQSHARLVRAARKSGQDAPSAPRIVIVGERIESRCVECKTVSDGFCGGTCMIPRCGGYLVSSEVVDLEVHGERPALAGWEFLAVVEPLTGGNLIRQVPDAVIADGELLRWRQGAVQCDHCTTVRRRLETFIVRADGTDHSIPKGAYKQVGRQCLSAFLGGRSPAAIVWALGWADLLSRAAGESDGEGGGWREAPQVFAPAVVLAWTAAVVRLNGFVSRKAAELHQSSSTSDVVSYLLTPVTGQGREAWRRACEKHLPTDADRACGAAALAWAKELPGVSDYERNLSLVARQEVLTRRHLGTLASAIQAHARVLGDAATLAARGGAPSAHQGTIGAKLELAVTIERCHTTNGNFGPRHIITMRDATGNAYVWCTGTATATPGSTHTVKGTVKRHSDYKGEAQTELTRCKLTA